MSAAKRGETQGDPGDATIPETPVVYEARPRHQRKSSQGQDLLCVNGMVQAQAVAQRIGQAAGGPVLIFELIAHGGVRPAFFGVVALVVEAGAIDIGDGVKRSINLVAESIHAIGLIDGLHVSAVQFVFEARETMLPARRPGYGEICAGQQIILPRALVKVRGKYWVSVEIPVALHAGDAIGMAGAHAQRRPVGQFRADIQALQRVRIIVVRALTHSVELVAEQVVIEAASRPGKRCIAVRRPQISAVRAKTQFGDGSAARASKNLDHAGHGIGAVQRALCASNKLQTIRALQRKYSKVESSTRIVYRHVVHDNFVVSGIAPADEQ